jgi:hypothetical protein
MAPGNDSGFEGIYDLLRNSCEFIHNKKSHHVYYQHKWDFS